MTEADIPLEAFLPNPPFDFVAAAQNGSMGFAAAAAVLAFLVGATWIGAEWSSRGLVALLFWEPRRYKVIATKIGVLIGAAAVFGVLAQAAWLGMAGILSAVAGHSSSQPPGFWSDLLATQGRGALLAVLAALGGFGLTNLVRNTGAALGAGFVYFAVVETAIRALSPAWQPWLLTNNAIALLMPGGFPVPVPGGSVDPSGFDGGREYLITNLQGGVLLGAVGAVIIGVGVVLFARRDVH
jgi:ABC-type transport system involved in multi-copper enzyme maturation permease subunit